MTACAGPRRPLGRHELATLLSRLTGLDEATLRYLQAATALTRRCRPEAAVLAETTQRRCRKHSPPPGRAASR